MKNDSLSLDVATFSQDTHDSDVESELRRRIASVLLRGAYIGMVSARLWMAFQDRNCIHGPVHARGLQDCQGTHVWTPADSLGGSEALPGLVYGGQPAQSVKRKQAASPGPEDSGDYVHGGRPVAPRKKVRATIEEEMRGHERDDS